MIATASPPRDLLDRREIFIAPGPKWKHIEAELLQAGIALPLFQRLAWVELSSPEHSRLVAVRDEFGRILGGVAVRIDKSRVLSGHRYMRVSRLGEGLPPQSWEPIVAALAKLGREEAKVLRLSVRVFSREHGAEIGALLERHGFHREPHPTAYRNTLSIDLRPEPEMILAGLNKSARKNLRDADKSSLCVKVITDSKYVERLNALELMALRRTQGTSGTQDWPSVMRLTQDHPELSRIVGLFLSEDEQKPEEMVGFAWGCMNGVSGEYRAGGTAHVPNLKVSMSHRLVRDLILWSKREGAQWFDMGGVTVGEPDSHPLHGVSVFKRHFTHHLEDIGEEWSMEPHPARARFVRWLGGYVRRSTDAMQRVRNGWH